MTDRQRPEDVEAGAPAVIAERLRTRFATLHDRDATAVFAAPGRVNLIGEHTDYNAGLCLPIALPHAAYVAVGPRSDGRLTVTSSQQEDTAEVSLDRIGPGRLDGWVTYVAGVVWALDQIGITTSGLDLAVDSRVPIGAGLSSSAALECATALAACSVADVPVDDGLRRDLVDVCMRAEQEVAGAPTGGMDQTVSLFAEPAHAVFLDCRDWSIEQVALDLESAGVGLLVIDTRVTHALVSGGYGERRADCERAAEELGVPTLREAAEDDVDLDRLSSERLRRRARHVVSEIGRVEQARRAIDTADMSWLGGLFAASHASLRDDFEVSSDELDLAVETATTAGALGARMTGGGFGGSAVALVPRALRGEVEQAVASAFAGRGLRPPGFVDATPSRGAHRVDP